MVAKTKSIVEVEGAPHSMQAELHMDDVHVSRIHTYIRTEIFS